MKEFGFFLGGCTRENPGDWYPLRGSDGKSGRRRDTGRTRELMHAAAGASGRTLWVARISPAATTSVRGGQPPPARVEPPLE
jgi:hypothetical protein